jgi:hypothetical protein
VTAPSARSAASRPGPGSTPACCFGLCWAGTGTGTAAQACLCSACVRARARTAGRPVRSNKIAGKQKSSCTSRPAPRACYHVFLQGPFMHGAALQRVYARASPLHGRSTRAGGNETGQHVDHRCLLRLGDRSIYRPALALEEGSRAPPLMPSRTYYAGPCIGRGINKA